ncbi:MAG: hypothetical protein PHX82_15850 [Paracoccaceae bacterium]|jgi:hypothetical protein|nr:hypothetical protein [Paracoccaceae bacterium]
MTQQPRTFALIEADLMQQMAERLERIERALAGVQMQPREEWLTVVDYAALVGRSPRTVRKWIDAGRVETKRAGSVVMVRR